MAESEPVMTRAMAGAAAMAARVAPLLIPKARSQGILLDWWWKLVIKKKTCRYSGEWFKGEREWLELLSLVKLE